MMRNSKVKKDYRFNFPILQSELPILLNLKQICCYIYSDARDTQRLSLLNFLSMPMRWERGYVIRCRLCQQFIIKFQLMQGSFKIVQVENRHNHTAAVIPKAMMPCYSVFFPIEKELKQAPLLCFAGKIPDQISDPNFSPSLKYLKNKQYKFLSRSNLKSNRMEVLVVLSPNMIKNYKRFGDVIKFQTFNSKIHSDGVFYNLGVFYAFDQDWKLQMVGYGIYIAHNETILFRLFDFFFRLHNSHMNSPKPQHIMTIQNHPHPHSPQTLITKYQDLPVNRALSIIKQQQLFKGHQLFDHISILQHFLSIKPTKKDEVYSRLLSQLMCSQQILEVKEIRESLESMVSRQGEREGAREYENRLKRILEQHGKIFYVNFMKGFLGLMPFIDLETAAKWNREILPHNIDVPTAMTKLQEVETTLLNPPTPPKTDLPTDPDLLQLSHLLSPLLFSVFMTNYNAMQDLLVKPPPQQIQGVTHCIEDQESGECWYVGDQNHCTCDEPLRMKLPCQHLLAVAKIIGKGYKHLIADRWKIQ